MGYQKELAHYIYKILTKREYRLGPLPNSPTRLKILDQINTLVRREEPIKILLFWGGAKNPNLKRIEADLAELTVFQQLKTIKEDVSNIYPPGLLINISPGDSRIHFSNSIDLEHTRRYITSLNKMLVTTGLTKFIKITPLSKLYDDFDKNFQQKIHNNISYVISNFHTIENHLTLFENAKRNIQIENITLYKQATYRYIAARITEEEAQIFSIFKDSIRASFMPYTIHYKHLIRTKTSPDIERILHLFSGRKGQRVQPWQAIGIQNGSLVIFLSQSKIPQH